MRVVANKGCSQVYALQVKMLFFLFNNCESFQWSVELMFQTSVAAVRDLDTALNIYSGYETLEIVWNLLNRWIFVIMSVSAVRDPGTSLNMIIVLDSGNPMKC